MNMINKMTTTDDTISAGPCIGRRGEAHEGVVGHRRRQARAVRGGVRQGLPELHHVGHRRPHLVPLLPLLLRQDPPRHHRPAGARHRVLLPVRQRRKRVQPQDPAGRAAHRSRPRRYVYTHSIVRLLLLADLL